MDYLSAVAGGKETRRYLGLLERGNMGLGICMTIDMIMIDANNGRC